MATSFTPITILPSTSSTNRNHRNRSSLTASASGSWWSPLFGWSSDPDSIHSSTPLSDGSVSEISDLDKPSECKSRFTPGCLTEEKAKQLRIKTVETANFHDIMYHSAIASRLASDVSGRNDR